MTMLNHGVEEIVGIAINAHCLATVPPQPSLYVNFMAHRGCIYQQTGILNKTMKYYQ